MGKHTYRAVDFQRVDWVAMGERVADERVVFAVDAAKTGFVATLMTPAREVLVTVKWSHPQQTRALVACVAGLPAREVEAVLEPTGTYGDPVRDCLREAGCAIYRVAAKRVSDAREVYDGVPSLHDAKAAYVIARLHLEGASQEWIEADAQRRTLAAQSSELGDCQERQQKALNRLEGLLARHWPEAPTILDLGSASLLRLLADYGTPAAVAADAPQAAAQLQRVGGHWLAAEKVDALVASAATTLGRPCVAAESERVRALAGEVLAMREQCRRLERRLSAQVGSEAGLRQQAAVVGAVTAAVLCACLGDARAYPNAGSYAKAMGLHLKERSSGKHKGQLRITRRGPGVSRFYLYFAVLRLIARAGPAKRWYDAKVARDGGRKGKAITALMRKLAKALWHVGQGEAFDEARLFGEAEQQRAA